MNPHASTRHLLAMVLTCVVAGIAFGPRHAHAGAEDRKSTAGASELLLPVGARGAALGAPVVSDAAGVEASFWNPAGMASLEGTEALFFHTDHFAGMNLNYGGVATHWGVIGTVGVSAKVLSVGDIIETTEDAPEGTGKVFSPTFTVLGVSYARQFTDRVRFGATMNLVDERILDASAQGLAFDFGVQYLTDWRGLAFGIVMKNFGPSMEFTGPSFELTFQRPDGDPTAAARGFSTSSTSFELPSHFVLAAAMNAYTSDLQRVGVMTAFQNNNFSGDQFSSAVEWTYRSTLSLRASWFGTYEQATDPLSGVQTNEFGSGDDLYQGYVLGAGANFNLGGSKASADFAWRPVREAWGDVVEFGLRVGF